MSQKVKRAASGQITKDDVSDEEGDEVETPGIVSISLYILTFVWITAETPNSTFTAQCRDLC